MNDLLQYEQNQVIQTKTRHRTPMVRTMSITNVDEHNKAHKSALDRARVSSMRLKRASMKHRTHVGRESGSSTPDADRCQQLASDSSDSGGKYQINVQLQASVLYVFQIYFLSQGHYRVFS